MHTVKTVPFFSCQTKERKNKAKNYACALAHIVSTCQEATKLYVELAKKHGLTPVQLALGFVRARPFVTSSIIGATSLDQLKEDIDAFTKTAWPLPPEIADDIEDIFKRYKDPAIL